MVRDHVRNALFCLVAACATLSWSPLAPGVVLDFSFDDAGNELVNGQDLSTPPEFGTFVAIGSSGANHLGTAIFDSTPGGPNAASADQDLLVGLGNIVILQNVNLPAQSEAGIFDTPNDTGQGGAMTFQFLQPGTTLRTIDLVDIDVNGQVELTLTDGAGLTRTFSVPDRWTRDIVRDGGLGYATLDFLSLDPQPGETGLLATAREDPGYNPGNIRRLDVRFTGSGGLDNLVFEPIPEPSCGVLLAVGLVVLGRMRHRAPWAGGSPYPFPASRAARMCDRSRFPTSRRRGEMASAGKAERL